MSGQGNNDSDSVPTPLWLRNRANNVSVDALTFEELIKAIIRTHDHNFHESSVALKDSIRAHCGNVFKLCQFGSTC